MLGKWHLLYYLDNLFSITLQAVQQDLQTKREGLAEAIRSVEDLLTDKGDSLSPQERENLLVALTKMKEQYSALTDSVDTSLSDVNTAINTAVQQNMQKVWEWSVEINCFFCINVLILFLHLIKPEGKGWRRATGDPKPDKVPADCVVLFGPNRQNRR